MSQRALIFLVFALGILSTAYLATLIVSSSPYTAERAVLWTFFCSLFIAITALISLCWYGIKRFSRMRTVINISPIIRKSALISSIIVISLVLNSLGIFKVIDIIPLMAAAVLIEFFFQADKRPQATIEYNNELE